jgi:sugar lactone lactonase YvrE
VVVVHLDSTTKTFAIGSGPGSNSGQFNYPYDVFFKNTSLYIGDTTNQRVQKLSLDGSNPITVFNLSELYWPTYLYVDHNDNIYFSDTFSHRVLLFHAKSKNFSRVAGTGVIGSNNDQLDRPYGIFVNHVGTIYIADCWNHRIMKWFYGALSGIIVVSNATIGASSTQLCYPTQIIVDTNEYMYISESYYSRISRWTPNLTFGVCIAGCTGTIGTASTQLNAPYSLAFDRNGSLYVSDHDNHRVQKFQILDYHSEYCIH